MTVQQILQVLLDAPDLSRMHVDQLRPVAERLHRALSEETPLIVPGVPPPVPDEEWVPHAARDAAADERWERIERAAVALATHLTTDAAVREALELVERMDRLRAEEDAP